MSASWSKYFFTGSGGKAVVHWFERERGSKINLNLKESHEELAEKVLACNVVLNTNTGLATPHMLVTDSPHGTRVTFKVLAYASCPELGSWKTLVKFQVSRHQCPQVNNFHLLDGPCVVRIRIQ